MNDHEGGANGAEPAVELPISPSRGGEILGRGDFKIAAIARATELFSLNGLDAAKFRALDDAVEAVADSELERNPGAAVDIALNQIQARIKSWQREEEIRNGEEQLSGGGLRGMGYYRILKRLLANYEGLDQRNHERELELNEKLLEVLELEGKVSYSYEREKLKARHKVFMLRSSLGKVEDQEKEDEAKADFYLDVYKKLYTLLEGKCRIAAVNELSENPKAKSHCIEAIAHTESALEKAKTEDSPYLEKMFQDSELLLAALSHKDFSKDELKDLPKVTLATLASKCREAKNVLGQIEANLAFLDKNSDSKDSFLAIRALRDTYEFLADFEKALIFAERLVELLESQRQGKHEMDDPEDRYFMARHDASRLKHLTGEATLKDTLDVQKYYEGILNDRSSIRAVRIAHRSLGEIATMFGEMESAERHYRELARVERANRGMPHSTTVGSIEFISGFLIRARNTPAAEVVERAGELSLPELKFWARVLDNFPSEKASIAKALLAREDVDLDGTIRAKLALSSVYERAGKLSDALVEIGQVVRLQRDNDLDISDTEHRLEFVRQKRRARQ